MPRSIDPDKLRAAIQHADQGYETSTAADIASRYVHRGALDPSEERIVRRALRVLRRWTGETECARCGGLHKVGSGFCPELVDQEPRPTTARPWTVAGSTGAGWSDTRHVYSAADRAAGGTGVVALVRGKLSDAELIARAVNAHDRMADGLREVDRYFDAIDAMQPDRDRGTEGRRVRALVRSLIAENTPPEDPDRDPT